MGKDGDPATLLDRAREPLRRLWQKSVADGLAEPDACVLFFASSSGAERAMVFTARGSSFEQAWDRGVAELRVRWQRKEAGPRWLRVESACSIQATSWGRICKQLAATKRNYWRRCIAFDADLEIAFLAQEFAGSALLYDSKQPVATPNSNNLRVYARRRHQCDLAWPEDPSQPMWLFDTRAVFTDGEKVEVIEHAGRNRGYRKVKDWGPEVVLEVIRRSTGYLARQVQKEGRYEYGWFPCFDRSIPTYNALRHASSTYALLEGWELTGDAGHEVAACRALEHLCKDLIREADLPDGTRAAFLVDTGNEVKLGGNGVCLLALSKYTELTGDRRYLPLLEKLALGVLHMQDASSGRFVHVLHWPALDVKNEHRIIYYDGEAAFGLMRLYGLTRDPRWLAAVEKAFEHFIAAEHWRAHDHWLSYCVNELTLYRSDPRYYRFGLDNVRGHLDFVRNRLTTFPTLLELMMAARKMIDRIQSDPEQGHLLDGFDLEKFQGAMEWRARYLLSGFFWPEVAMFFCNPERILDGFFIRHHGFRVRIDDVEHYLSGYVAYWKYLQESGSGTEGEKFATVSAEPPAGSVAVVAWGGDVNLGRRQHYVVAKHGPKYPLEAVPALRAADIAIVNLECVVTTVGEVGVEKSEGGPFYLRARPQMLRVLLEGGVDAVATANNHSGDYGPDALIDQSWHLRDWGIAHVGSGADLEQALTPVYLKAASLRIAVFAFDATQPEFAATAHGPGTAYVSPARIDLFVKRIQPLIARAAGRADVVLASVHWGRNGLAEPEPAMLRLGDALIDVGFDAVLGAGSHVLQGVRIHKGRPVVYGAGDLLFDARERRPAEAGVFHLELDAHGVRRVVFHPVRVGFGRTEQLYGEAARQVTGRFSERCAALGSSAVPADDGRCVINVRPEGPAVGKPIQESVPMGLDSSGLSKEWTVEEVPVDAALPEPVVLGPLELLGVRLASERLTDRQMIFVESYWRLREPTEVDWRLEFRAVPKAGGRSIWGQGSDHDPCDWLWPTRHWRPGEIYRDHYGLRPPPMSRIRNGHLQLNIGLRSDQGKVAEVSLSHVVEVALRRPTAFPAPVYRVTTPDALGAGEPGATWTAEQLEKATGGRWLVPPPPGWKVQMLHHARDGRKLEEFGLPPLYVAFDYPTVALHERYSAPSDETWDSHDRLAALHQRLAGAIVSRPVPDLPADFPLLQVGDGVRAYIELGAASRQRLDGRVVAVTGSAGKSTLVRMLQQVLATCGPIIGTQANHNSRCGMLLTLANTPEKTLAAVVEASSAAINAPRYQNIRLVHPDIAVVTNIAPSHLAPGQTVADIGRRKIRIVEGMTPGSLVVLWAESDCYEDMAHHAAAKGMRLLSFGASDRADIRLVDYDSLTGKVVAELPDGHRIQYSIGAAGRHMALNSLACIAVLTELGLPLSAALPSLAAFESLPGRGQILDVVVGGKQLRIIDDAYNANPISMAAALRGMRDVERPLPEGRRVLVLGDMLELGSQTEALHAGLVSDVRAAQPDLLLLCGRHMTHLQEELTGEFPLYWFPEVAILRDGLLDLLQPGDLVLVKSSAGTRLSSLVRHLQQLHAVGLGQDRV